MDNGPELDIQYESKTWFFNFTEQTLVGRKLVCNEAAVSAFPATQSPQLHQRTTSLLQRAEQGVRIIHDMPFRDLPYAM